MPTVVVGQAGHNEPRGRAPGYGWLRGQTGTYREIEFNDLVATALVAQLGAVGVDAGRVGADPPFGTGDLFISLHADSFGARIARRGDSPFRRASVGYPTTTDLAPREVLVASRRAATIWKRHHGLIYPGRFLADNYAPALPRYYGWKNRPGRAGGGRFKAMYLAEACVLPNRSDERWAFSHIDEIAGAHVATVVELFSLGPVKPPPIPIPLPPGDENMIAVVYVADVDNGPTTRRLRVDFGTREIFGESPGGMKRHADWGFPVFGSESAPVNWSALKWWLGER